MSSQFKHNAVIAALSAWFDARRPPRIGKGTTATPVLEALRDAFFLSAL